MRVLLDATAVPANRGGVGRYVDHLGPDLARAGADVVVVCNQRDLGVYEARAPSAEVIGAPRSVSLRAWQLAWEQTGLPLLVRRV